MRSVHLLVHSRIRRLDAHLRAAEVTRFVGDVVAAYEPVTGKPGLFRFTQLRAALRPAET